MQITQDWTRKRTAHNSACWECHRRHRGCDGERPCKRCVDLGRGDSCRSPAPNERIPQKRKKPKPDEGSPQSRSPPKIRKHTGFLIVNPQKRFSSPETEDAIPLASPLFSTSSSSSTNAPESPPNLDRTNETFYVSRFNPQTPPRTVFQSTTLSQDFRLQQLVQHPSSFRVQQQHTQLTTAYDSPLTMEELLAEFRAVEAEETSDHRETTSSVFQSLTIPDDMMRLTESLFTPFGLRDATQV